mmetsp:Transcript_41094/g.99046  ORF Transcript_41094/g.99046 Transcript_41094/m.99046 type:complete len:615 (-) Transcript_41094:138-1982(-)
MINGSQLLKRRVALLKNVAMIRALSSQVNHLALWQRGTWETFLQTGRGSDNLFRSIDTNHSETITVPELHVFLDSVGHKGVHPRAFKMLDELAHDHSLSRQEFKSWLVLATNFHQEMESQYALGYERLPHVGERKPQPDDADFHTWNEHTMSQAVRKMQYAVRGQVVMRADELQSQGKEILYTNIGNPQAVGQSPISYYRQVMALCDLPAEDGIDHPNVHQMFPADVVTRAKECREAIGPAGTGAYTGSQGILQFRQDVADFISERDGHQSYAGNIFLTNGASSAIELVLTSIISSEIDGVMIPIPQYPIYSALIAKLAGRQVGYFLDENSNWAATESELTQRLEDAQDQGVDVKALAIINPGNPTGQVYSREDLEVICKFCSENGIVLLADEVYQRNVYNPSKSFLSAKKVALETPGCEDLQLVSFHSTSKGVIGECGRRGGYMELHNIDKDVQAQLYKLASSGLCSNVPGQVMTSLMVKPPKSGEDSYERFEQEESDIFEGMKNRAKALVEGLNEVDGISCNPAEGAMYAFPSIKLPPKAIEAAEKMHVSPDTLYALSLLEETGICVVPASGFGQEEGRFGFRTTFLPPDDKMMSAVDKFKSHHEQFCAKYA